MKSKLSLLWLLVLILPLYLFVTRYHAPEVTNDNFLQGYDNTDETKVNKNLFYINRGEVKEAADPHVITYNGKYYLYATNANKNYDCSYLQCWSSSNLTDWKKEGICFQPSLDNWCIDGLWAPEVIERNGMFYLYYSGYKITPENEGQPNFWWKGHQIGVAVSSSPTGPFIDVPNESDPKEAKFSFPFAVIDPSPFIDEDGTAYLLVSKDQYRYSESDRHSSILIAKLKDNMVDIDGDWTELIRPDKDYENKNNSISSWNEAPFMYKRDGLYYLLYSCNYYQDREYCIGVATSCSPFGPFVKYDEPLLSSKDNWDFVSGTGHCSLFNSIDNKELFMAYHVHVDPNLAGSERMIYFDRVAFINDKMVVNGPSTSPQPLPSGSGEYHNIASESTVYVNDIKANRLIDGVINPFSNDLSYEYATNEKKVKLVAKFDKPRVIRAIMLYDSASDIYALNNVKKIKINDKMVVDLSINELYNNGQKIPLTAFTYEFNEIISSSIEIYLESESLIYLNELVILGK